MTHLCDICTKDCKAPAPVVACTKHVPVEVKKEAPKKESKNVDK